MTIRYETRRGDDHDLRERIKALAHERRRFGYRRLHVLLRREGHLVNHKRLFRLYREEKLTVRKRGGRKRAIGTRAPMLVPMAANDRWSLDFVSDQLTDGRRFRVLTVVDDCTRECLGLVADTSLSGLRVARELDRIIEGRGKPEMIVSDNVSIRRRPRFRPPEHSTCGVSSSREGVALACRSACRQCWRERRRAMLAGRYH